MIAEDARTPQPAFEPPDKYQSESVATETRTALLPCVYTGNRAHREQKDINTKCNIIRAIYIHVFNASNNISARRTVATERHGPLGDRNWTAKVLLPLRYIHPYFTHKLCYIYTRIYVCITTRTLRIIYYAWTDVRDIKPRTGFLLQQVPRAPADNTGCVRQAFMNMHTALTVATSRRVGR